MCEWQSSINPEYSCSGTALVDSDCCILHASNDQKSSSAFREALARHISATAQGAPIDLTGVRFPVGGAGLLVQMLGARVQGSIVLCEAVFAERLGLENLELEGGLRAENVRIEGGFYLSACVIRGDVCLRGMQVVDTRIGGHIPHFPARLGSRRSSTLHLKFRGHSTQLRSGTEQLSTVML